MTITSIKQITFANLMKDFKKYVAVKEEGKRVVLNYVYFDGETFTATNSHILLKVNKNVVSNIPIEIVTGSLINPSTLEIAMNTNYNYPNTDRLFPSNCKLNIRLNGSLDELYTFVKYTNALLKGKAYSKLYTFYTHGDYIESRAMQFENGKKEMKNQLILKHRHVLENVDDKQIIFNLRSEYITKSLMTIRKLSKLSKDDIQLKVLESMRPIVFEQADVFKILVMPVRLY